MAKSKRLIVAGIVLSAALIYLITTAVSDSTMYYVTVDEVIEQGLQTSDRSMRLSGEVTDGSIDWQPREMRLTFDVAGENGQKIKATYVGPRPDNFVPGASAVLEGRFDVDGHFVVDSLMLACPSRFEAADEALT